VITAGRLETQETLELLPVLSPEVSEPGPLLEVVTNLVAQGLPEFVLPDLPAGPSEYVDERAVVEDDEAAEIGVLVVLPEDEDAARLGGDLGPGFDDDPAVELIEKGVGKLVEEAPDQIVELAQAYRWAVAVAQSPSPPVLVFPALYPLPWDIPPVGDAHYSRPG